MLGVSSKKQPNNKINSDRKTINQFGSGERPVLQWTIWRFEKDTWNHGTAGLTENAVVWLLSRMGKFVGSVPCTAKIWPVALFCCEYVKEVFHKYVPSKTTFKVLIFLVQNRTWRNEQSYVLSLVQALVQRALRRCNGSERRTHGSWSIRSGRS